jgi:hypothetical protein
MAEHQLDVDECIAIAHHGSDGYPTVCGLTGKPHRLVWFHAAYWCRDCRMKVTTCCEGQPND